ncbi:MAG TPA: Zn-dependent protease with chaperone function, partial [Polyangiaceae bacterium]|nr:Zn-dependent protease with chaperone function [Polyangiaceae bacterium]
MSAGSDLGFEYPAGPAEAPADLTRPTRSYRLHAWVAMLALLGFVALYAALTGWFCWTTYRMVRGALQGGPNAFQGFLMAVPTGFFAIFLVKGLFFVKRGQLEGLTEITREEQPELLAFLERIAAETGAPKPHRVFLSPRVNAGVFYDISLLNLLLPTRKNLEIGLGLINVLSVSELKAVLAHEFGHFAQRTMAVGRWVYISQQVAAAIIANRDALDRLLIFISSIDIRVAWIGWIMRVIVWAIRAVLETAFGLVVIAERALSKEMELNADLVSVSVCGSDALVHALHKLQAADEAWEQAVGFMAAERGRGRATADLFAVQTRFLEHTRRVLGDETYGAVPPLPEGGHAEHRVFKAALGQPPRMWSSHPPNREREDNAKRCYIPVRLCEQSAWAVITEPDVLRARVTASLLDSMDGDGEPAALDTVPIEESIAALDEDFDRPSLDRRYHGLYLGRSPVRAFADVREAYGTVPADEAAIRQALDALYPESLGDDVVAMRDLEEEHGMLEALRDGLLDAPGGVIQHRGRMLRKKELADVVESVDSERAAARRKLEAHDRACRAAHRAAAQHIGRGWDEYHHSLVTLLHYATHGEANLEDAAGLLANTWSVVIADGRVSSAELDRLVRVATDLYMVLSRLDDQRPHVALPEPILAKLEIESWAGALPEEFALGMPSTANMGDWLTVVDSWLNAYGGALGALRRVVLDELLLTEARLDAWMRGERPERDALDAAEDDPDGIPAAPAPGIVPPGYETLLVGHERPRQKKLDWWDRFQTADGVVPSIARFAVAAAIVGAVMAMGGMVGTPTVVAYNGLDREVTVDLGGRTQTLAPYGHAEIELAGAGPIHVEARTDEGTVIEAFDEMVDASFGRYVYNVAGASPLVEWTAAYGSAAEVPPRMLGAPRWTTTEVNHVFEEPPQSVSTKSSGATRKALAAPDRRMGLAMLGWLDDQSERDRIALLHARWDSLTSTMTPLWMSRAAMKQDGFNDVLAERLEEVPNHVGLLRMEQDMAEGDAKEAVCRRHATLADAKPDDYDLAYLTARCLTDDDKARQAFYEGHEAAPNNPWFAMAVGMHEAREGRWAQALPLLERARKAVPFLAPVADTEARVRRRIAMSEGRFAELADLAVAWPLLEHHLRVEGSEPLDSPYLLAQRALSRGQIDSALSTCGNGPECDSLIWLVAASDGAGPSEVQSAMALAEVRRGLGGHAAFAALALGRREGQHVAALTEAL